MLQTSLSKQNDNNIFADLFRSQNMDRTTNVDTIIRYCSLTVSKFFLNMKEFYDSIQVMHVRTHKRERPFVCQICGQVFRLK